MNPVINFYDVYNKQSQQLDPALNSLPFKKQLQDVKFQRFSVTIVVTQDNAPAILGITTDLFLIVNHIIYSI